MSTAGVFAGTAGLGVGFLIGWVWEQFHRRRRARRHRAGKSTDQMLAETSGPEPGVAIGRPASSGVMPNGPRLRLVSVETTPDTHVVGRQLTSVRFRAQSVEFEFGGVAIKPEGQAMVSSGSERFCYPDEGSRDALCGLIGGTVKRMRVAPNHDVELTFDDGSELALLSGRPVQPEGILPSGH
ncbi:MAG TPA: hypothetical protein VII02_01460, partial [Gemmatimonadaceae bacterium]